MSKERVEKIISVSNMWFDYFKFISIKCGWACLCVYINRYKEDEICLEYAIQTGGLIVTNDKFRKVSQNIHAEYETGAFCMLIRLKLEKEPRRFCSKCSWSIQLCKPRYDNVSKTYYRTLFHWTIIHRPHVSEKLLVRSGNFMVWLMTAGV